MPNATSKDHRRYSDGSADDRLKEMLGSEDALLRAFAANSVTFTSLRGIQCPFHETKNPSHRSARIKLEAGRTYRFKCRSGCCGFWEDVFGVLAYYTGRTREDLMSEWRRDGARLDWMPGNGAPAKSGARRKPFFNMFHTQTANASATNPPLRGTHETPKIDACDPPISEKTSRPKAGQWAKLDGNEVRVFDSIDDWKREKERLTGYRIVADYSDGYRNPSTDVVTHLKVRLEPRDDTSDEKTFRTAYLHGGKVYDGWPGGQLDPLYLNPAAYALVKAGRDDALAMVEGEKCANALQQLGFPACSTPFGADKHGHKLAKVDWSVLGVREVVLWPDRDAADHEGVRVGEAFMSKMPAHLADFGIDCRLVDVASTTDAEDGYDAADFMKENNEVGVETLKEMVMQVIENAKPVVESAEVQNKTAGAKERCGTDSVEATGSAKPSRSRRLRTTSAADIEAKKVQWFWRNRIVKNAVNVVAGPGGVGKSFLTMFMAALASTGGSWPDGGGAVEACDVLLLCAEDDQSCVIKPRLVANGADCRRIRVADSAVKISPDGKETEIAFTLDDIGLIEDHLDEYPNTKLVVIDPIGSFIGGKVDTNTDNQVRAVLAPLKLIAESRGVTFVLIAHHNKSKGTDPDEMILGSRAFSAIARSCLHVFEDRDDQERKLLLAGKCNVGKQAPGLAYKITEAADGMQGAIEFVPGTLDMNAKQYLQEASKPGPDAYRQEQAAELWRELLVDQPVLSATAKQAAASRGINWKNMERAMKAEHVRGRPGVAGWEYVRETPDEAGPFAIAA